MGGGGEVDTQGGCAKKAGKMGTKFSMKNLQKFNWAGSYREGFEIMASKKREREKGSRVFLIKLTQITV